MSQVVQLSDFISNVSDPESLTEERSFNTKDCVIIGQPKTAGDSVYGLIERPSEKIAASETVEDHASDPIKNVNDIYRIKEYLLSKKRYRDNMLFIVGINFGLRVSDLRMLRFCDLIDDKLRFKEKFPVWEIKTRNTKKRKTNRYITINSAVKEAVRLYLANTPNVRLDDYMFRGVARNCKNEPMTNGSIYNIIHKWEWQVGIDAHLGTHSLRKTFCYHQMLMSRNDPRKLMLLSKMLNHSSIMQTMTYIGITDDEITEAYKGLNLGSDDCYANLLGEVCEEPDQRGGLSG